jgi:4-amino-4-deoxy-L-arabinose transferase-like glycosyltransferase
VTFGALLLATLVLYLWGLDRNGWANAYYAAAVEAATKSWKAFFFGSLDSSNFITVDKTPAFLWVMDISARIFGLNNWSILVPQALEGVATVAVTYLGVRRWFGASAALLAGAVVAVTPVAALMFRYNNPDALLVLLVTGGAYATLRAVEDGRTRWLVLAATLIGTAFLAKMLQAFLIVPVVAAVYLWAGRPALWQRIKQLVIAAITLIVASGWWITIVELWPASARPYIGGSQTNSELELILGYNGFGRITGNETGSVIARAAGGIGNAVTSLWGPTGWDRLFNTEFGGQASWLIPAALILCGAAIWHLRSGVRSDVARAAIVLWGGWLVVTGAVFSFAQGIIHPYYTIALAPPIGSLVGAGAAVLWRRRSELGARIVMAAAVGFTAWWSYELLDRSPDWHPELRVAVAAAGVVVAVLILLMPALSRPLGGAVGVAAIALCLAGPAAYTLSTVQTSYNGALPSAGPAVASARGFGFGGQGAARFAGGPPAGFAPGGAGFAPPANGFPPGGSEGAPRGGGGFLGTSRVGSQLAAMLESDASQYSWVAATVDANSAASYELATGEPVMAIGGFNGTDPAPTLAQFQQMVAQREIHYFIGSGRGMGGGSTSNAIESWVSANFASTTVDGVTIYDLTQTTS